MWSVTLAIALAIPFQDPQDPPQQKDPPKVSQRELGRRAARALKAAFKLDEHETIRAALREHGLVDDPDVARALGAGIAHDDPAVRKDTIRALRYNPNAKAGSELLSHQKDENVLGSEELTIEWMLALGQHGETRAIPFLIEGFGPKRESTALATARIQALGRMRHPEAVESLIKFARSGFAKGLDAPIVASLRALTGGDEGDQLRPWVLWWNRAKLGYHVPEEPGQAGAAWTALWAERTAEDMFADLGPTTGGGTGESPWRRGGDGGRGSGGRGGGDTGRGGSGGTGRGGG